MQKKDNPTKPNYTIKHLNYIAQASKGQTNWLKIAITLAFVLIPLGLNTIAALYVDVESVMQEMISSKSKNQVLIQLLLPMIFFLLIIMIRVQHTHKRSLVSLTTARNNIDWKRVFFAFFLWLSISIVAFSIDVFLIAPENYTLNFNLESFLILCLIAFTLIPVQVAFEEYFFRGYLLQELGNQLNSRMAPLLASSILFGLMHVSNPEFSAFGNVILVYYIASGLFFGAITLIDDGLELALGMHAANNIGISLFVTSSYAVIQTDALFIDTAAPTIDWKLFMPIFLFYPIVFLIFSKIYQWKLVSNKLMGKV